MTKPTDCKLFERDQSTSRSWCCATPHNHSTTNRRNTRETSAPISYHNQATGPQTPIRNRFFEEREHQSRSNSKKEARAARIGSTRSETMLAARFWKGQGASPRPHRPARLALTLANNLALTIVLVALFASFAIAASSSSWLPDYSRSQLLARLADRVAKLDDRVLVNDLNQRDVQLEADDEQFLRQLKQAAEQLNARLADEAREQQPFSVQFESGSAGRLPAPRYELLENRDANFNERDHYALPLESLAAGPNVPVGQQSDGDLLDSTADDNHEAESEPKANLLNYLLMLDKAREMERTSAQEQAQEEPRKTIVSLGDIGGHLEASKRERPRETTLLQEEEEAEEEEKASSSTRGGKQAPRAAVYGVVARTAGERLDSAKQQQAASASMFDRLKANLAYYLPFLGQLKVLQRAGSEQLGSPQAINRTKQRETSGPLAAAADEFKKTNHHDKQRDDKDSRLQPAKQSFSATKAIGVDQEGPARAKHLRLRVNVSQPTDERMNSGENVPLSPTRKRLSVALADDERDLADMVAAAAAAPEQEEQRPREASRAISAMRQSSLLLPLREELLVRGAPDEGASGERDSLLGRYIYAPTQHYYLNALPAHPHLGPSQQQQQLKPAYALQKEPGSLLSFAHLIDPNGPAINKSAPSNDLYFLVMVGAFCVMAMAVVLAAGLFAYRVQQQRKTSQDTDYPTYGVVGPNNITGAGAGKSAGAAAFMNGYFSSPLASGKSASAKHLPDLYGQAAALDSGLEKSASASISSSAHKKNSSSTSSSGRAANNEAPARANNANNLFASTAANQDAARMYHYQHQKQQMIVSDRSSAGRHTSASDLDSDEADDDGSYTVYECPGLASAHEMEIKNPLFNDDQSP